MDFYKVEVINNEVGELDKYNYAAYPYSGLFLWPSTNEIILVLKETSSPTAICIWTQVQVEFFERHFREDNDPVVEAEGPYEVREETMLKVLAIAMNPDNAKDLI